MRVVRLPGIHHDASCILVSGKSESVVVDPGTSWYQANVVERIESKLDSNAAISKILLTHRHYDTAGASSHLSAHWDATCHIHSDGANALESGDMFTTWASRFNSDMPATKVETFEDGHFFDLGGGNIEVIHSPGHTSDSCCFWIENEQILLAGDLIPKKAHISRWDFPTGCLPDLVESIEYLIEMDIKQLVPGHGETIIGAASVLAELEQQHQVLTEILEAKGVRPSAWPRPHPTCNWFTPEPPLAE
tara:strand:+ start:1229 stop:1972 length:744 start_codon:yes stop_codon:yes gene_type:complete